MALAALAAGLTAAEDGGQPLAFTKLAVGARPAAMGQAYGAVGGDAYGFPNNPALLASLKDLRLGSQWASLPSGQSQQFLALGRPVDSSDDLAYGLAYHRQALDAPIEKRRANTPDPDSTFSGSASVFTVGLAGWLWPKRFASGASLKVLAETLGEASSGGFSADFGCWMHTWPGLDLGLDLQDLASRLTWNTGAVDDIPLLFRGALAWQAIAERLLLSADFEKSQAQAAHLHFGSEFWALPGSLALRAGWNQGLLSAGFGLRTRLTSLGLEGGLDYALAGDPLGDGALQHRFSLDLAFGLN